MRVFVTGIGGFVGRRLRARLEARGDEVSGADRELDVTDASALVTAFADHAPDAIVHLAAQSSVAGSIDAPRRTFRTNFFGTQNVLRAAGASAPRARIVLIGSGDQYGPQPSGALPVRESTAMAPRSPYARSKWAGERLGLAAAEAGQQVVCVRAFNHSGAGQSDHFVASSFARQAAAIADGRQEPRLRVGNLESVRDFLDVEDVIDAYLRLLDAGRSGRVYNVASGRGLAIREVLDCVLEHAGSRAEIEADPARHRPTDALVGDAERLRSETGWAPTRDFRQTLRELVDAWHEADATI